MDKLISGGLPRPIMNRIGYMEYMKLSVPTNYVRWISDTTRLSFVVLLDRSESLMPTNQVHNQGQFEFLGANEVLGGA